VAKALGKIKGMPVVLEEPLAAMGTPGKIRVFYGKDPVTGGAGYAAVYAIGRKMLPVPGVSETAIGALQSAKQFLTTPMKGW
jgi:hypothetical protein